MADKQIENCIYKKDLQLQQLKAENEELKKEVNRHLKQQEIKDNYLIPKSKEYKQCLDEIEGICKKSWPDSGITIDYFKRNNYSWKQHQIRSLICRFEQIMRKIEEVKVDNV